MDATTNPSILLAASKLDDYKRFLDQGIAYAKTHGSSDRQEVSHFFVLMAMKVAHCCPGYHNLINPFPVRSLRNHDGRLL